MCNLVVQQGLSGHPKHWIISCQNYAPNWQQHPHISVWWDVRNNRYAVSYDLYGGPNAYAPVQMLEQLQQDLTNWGFCTRIRGKSGVEILNPTWLDIFRLIDFYCSRENC